MDTMELKPCPFCGCKEVETIYRFEGDGRYSVMCQSCGAQSAPTKYEHEAIKHWNMRVEPIKVTVETPEKPKDILNKKNMKVEERNEH